MIATPPRTIPVPDAVASLPDRQLPDRVLDAVAETAEAVRMYAGCRGPQYAEARQLLEARIARANKILAAHNPGLVRPARQPTGEAVTPDEREAAKARFRARLQARRQVNAREYLLTMLCATNTHADAEAILTRFEQESETADRLSKVMDLCDEMERKGITSGEPFTVRRVHRLALGDD